MQTITGFDDHSLFHTQSSPWGSSAGMAQPDAYAIPAISRGPLKLYVSVMAIFQCASRRIADAPLGRATFGDTHRIAIDPQETADVQQNDRHRTRQGNTCQGSSTPRKAGCQARPRQRLTRIRPWRQATDVDGRESGQRSLSSRVIPYGAPEALGWRLWV